MAASHPASPGGLARCARGVSRHRWGSLTTPSCFSGLQQRCRLVPLTRRASAPSSPWGASPRCNAQPRRARGARPRAAAAPCRQPSGCCRGEAALQAEGKTVSIKSLSIVFPINPGSASGSACSPRRKAPYWEKLFFFGKSWVVRLGTSGEIRAERRLHRAELSSGGAAGWAFAVSSESGADDAARSEGSAQPRGCGPGQLWGCAR